MYPGMTALSKLTLGRGDKDHAENEERSKSPLIFKLIRFGICSKCANHLLRRFS